MYLDSTSAKGISVINSFLLFGGINSIKGLSLRLRKPIASTFRKMLLGLSVMFSPYKKVLFFVITSVIITSLFWLYEDSEKINVNKIVIENINVTVDKIYSK